MTSPRKNIEGAQRLCGYFNCDFFATVVSLKYLNDDYNTSETS